MYQEKKSTRVTNTHTLPPAQLWVGNHSILVDEVTSYLQNIFCDHNKCNSCTTCLHIAQQQHHAITWVAPEKTYTLEHLEPIFTTISYSLEQNSHHFFIICNADLLPAICANKLLKSIEEPPKGYHFILLTERKENVIDTIRSRCMITEFTSKTGIIKHEQLFSCFATLQKTDPITFARILDQSKITEHETTDLLDALISHWSEQYKQTTDQKQVQLIKTIIEYITESYKILPMPGGSKLFWRNFYMK